MQERVAGLGGVLEVKNRPDGRGVIVSARIPLRAGERSGAGQRAGAGDRAAMKILLIDDHTVVREGVRRLLSSMEGVEI